MNLSAVCCYYFFMEKSNLLKIVSVLTHTHINKADWNIFIRYLTKALEKQGLNNSDSRWFPWQLSFRPK